MEVGSKVRVVSFNGTLTAPAGTDPSEDYWQLVGSQGVVVQDPAQESKCADFSGTPRLLVRFDRSVVALGLHCHNNVENALWLLESDLESVALEA
jgi:hypothetical protein